MTYQVCVRCVMDTSDPEITFDSAGVCNHCRRFDALTPTRWFPNEQGKIRLDCLVDEIKNRNSNKPYDCIMGLSGGIDSSYLALLLKSYELRVLAVHVDGGWNSELAVSNIEALISYCGFDLHTHVVEWDVMRRLQLAYFRSGVSNLDVPQDHVFFAVLHKFALKNGCSVFMSGGNIATEFVMPSSWHGSAMDAINLRDIFRQHGEGNLRGYETIGFWDWNLFFQLRGFRQIRPLNYVPYSKTLAVKELEKIGWRSYERKHGESTFTKFFQNHFLPERFGYDKRRPHLASRILSGEISREQAIRELQLPLYEEIELKRDIAYICKKLDITENDLEQFMTLPLKHYSDYANWDKNFEKLKNVKTIRSYLRKVVKGKLG